MAYKFLPFAMLAASPIFADEFVSPSLLTDVEIYPSGATLWRDVAVDLPSGTHDILVPNLSSNFDSNSLQINAQDLQILGVTVLPNMELPNPTLTESPEIAGLRRNLEAAEAALKAHEDAMAHLEIKRQAAVEAAAALKGVNLSQIAAEQNRLVSEIINDLRTSTEQALTAQSAAEMELRPYQATADTLREAVIEAQKALDDARPATRSNGVKVTVHADEAIRSSISIRYTSGQAGWAPTYDISLDRDEKTVTFERGAIISQATGEHWQNVNVTLATSQPNRQKEAPELYPNLLRIGSDQINMSTNAPVMSLESTDRALIRVDTTSAAAPKITTIDGLQTRFDLPTPISISPTNESQKVSIGSLEMDSEIFARVAPNINEAAYLTANITNTSGQALLSAEAMLFVDGAYMGQAYLNHTAQGHNFEIGFGQIDGLQVTTQTRRNEGESGILTTSNEIKTQTEYTFANNTQTDWELRMRAQIPYSEQEDLNITSNAQPTPQLSDVDGRQGVHEWRFQLDSGDETSVEVSTEIRWPEGMSLY